MGRKESQGSSSGSRTTFTYRKKWTHEPVGSLQFSHTKYRGLNENLFKQVADYTQYANTVTLGAYRLPSFLIKEIDDSHPIDINLPAKDDNMSVSGNEIYLGKDINNPQIGDVSSIPT